MEKENNAARDGWIVTDDACNQCCKVISESMRVFEFVQMNAWPASSTLWSVGHEVIDLNLYSSSDIVSSLRFFGYKDMDNFKEMNGGEIEWRLIAEMIFEECCADPGNYPIFSDYAQAIVRLNEITGLQIA